MSKKKSFSRKWRMYVKAARHIVRETFTDTSESEAAKQKVMDDLNKTMKEQRSRIAAAPRIR
jgi:hypothetical protein